LFYFCLGEFSKTKIKENKRKQKLKRKNFNENRGMYNKKALLNEGLIYLLCGK